MAGIGEYGSVRDEVKNAFSNCAGAACGGDERFAPWREVLQLSNSKAGHGGFHSLDWIDLGDSDLSAE